jgi:hypothetical protein
MEKDLIKYDGIEFSLPLAVGQPQSYLQYFLIALAVFFCWWIFLEKRKDKKTSSLKFQV